MAATSSFAGPPIVTTSPTVKFNPFATGTRVSLIFAPGGATLVEVLPGTAASTGITVHQYPPRDSVSQRSTGAPPPETVSSVEPVGADAGAAASPSESVGMAVVGVEAG